MLSGYNRRRINTIEEDFPMALDIEQSLIKARELSETGQSDEARMLLLEILQQDKNHHTALLMLGGSYFCSEKFQEAEMVFERLVLMEPGTGQFSIALFNSLWKQGRTDEAVEEIRRFLAVADRVKEIETVNQYVAITKEIAAKQ